MTRKLRLLVTKVCDRNCAGCCNKDYDLNNLQIFHNFNGWDEIMITGGEPLLFPRELKRLLNHMDHDQKTRLYLYTASMKIFDNIDMLNAYFDGIQLTIHDVSLKEIKKFNAQQKKLIKLKPEMKMRLSVFPELKYAITIEPKIWNVVRFQDWIVNCPLPEGETLGRLPVFLEHGGK
jgi:organic radical activating enzyme